MAEGLVLPALSFFAVDRRLDEGANAAYASAVSEIPDVQILLFGTTGEGLALERHERDRLLELWLAHLSPARLVVRGATADPAEANPVGYAGARFMVRPWPEASRESLIAYLQRLSDPPYLYSHPAHSPLVAIPSLLDALADAGCPPRGVKVSKASLRELADLRTASGSVELWHGTDRDIRGSFGTGADGVVSQAVATLSIDPAKELTELQRDVDRVRRALDGASGAAKLARLKGLAATVIPGLGDAVR